jgi:hypothetical protein
VTPATPVLVVRDPTGAAAVLERLREAGLPVTLLLHPEHGARALRDAIEAGSLPGSWKPAGAAPGGAAVVVWAPSR